MFVDKDIALFSLKWTEYMLKKQVLFHQITTIA